MGASARRASWGSSWLLPLTTATTIAMVLAVSLMDLAGSPIAFSPKPTLAISLAAVAAAGLLGAGVSALRLHEESRRSTTMAIALGAFAVAFGTLEVTLGVNGSHWVFGAVLWLGQGLLMFGLGRDSRVKDWALAVTCIATSLLGVAGVLARVGNQVSGIEQAAAVLMALSLSLTAVYWLISPNEQPGIRGGVALLSLGLAISILFRLQSLQRGDAADLVSIVWLIVAGALTVVYLERHELDLLRRRHESAFELARFAEQQRVLLEMAELESAIVRHDCASSLTAMEGGIHVLATLHDSGRTARLHSMTAFLEAEVGRVRRLLARQEGNTSMCSVAQVLAPQVALYRARGMTINLDLDDPGTIIEMAADDFAEVVQNLISNCLIHAPESSMSIIGRSVLGFPRLLLSFVDDGPGIAADVEERLFEPNVSTREGGGLGLHVVRSVVRAVGGDAYSESVPHGTCFRLDLPTYISPLIDLRDNSVLSADEVQSVVAGDPDA